MISYAMLPAALVAVFWLLGTVTATSQLAQPPDPWFGPSRRPNDFQAPRAPLGPFSIQIPKDWQIVPGHGHLLFTLVEKTRNSLPIAAIAVEQMPLGASLDPKDLSGTNAQFEVDFMRERQPGGENFEQQIKDADGRRFIFIQYTKPGLGGQDRVVQYSVPAGSVMYRLLCIAPVAQLAKYQTVFAHVAASFKPTPP